MVPPTMCRNLDDLTIFTTLGVGLTEGCESSELGWELRSGDFAGDGDFTSGEGDLVFGMEAVFSGDLVPFCCGCDLVCGFACDLVF